MSSNPTLPTGYSAVASGKIVNAVTCLEMRAKPAVAVDLAHVTGLHLEHWPTPDIDAYRALFRAVGSDWLWASRLTWSDEKLRATLHDPLVAVYVLTVGDRQIGLLELDFRAEAECELAYFGLVRDTIGAGAGRFLMMQAIELAWSRPINRFWVHTCHFDHPAALRFYQRAGFRPYAMMVEVLDDPRLTGILPRTAAPHVPLIDVG